MYHKIFHFSTFFSIFFTVLKFFIFCSPFPVPQTIRHKDKFREYSEITLYYTTSLFIFFDYFFKNSLDFFYILLYSIPCAYKSANLIIDAGVAELADAQASGACGSNIVWVQVPSPAYFFYSFLSLLTDCRNLFLWIAGIF